MRKKENLYTSLPPASLANETPLLEREYTEHQRHYLSLKPNHRRTFSPIPRNIETYPIQNPPPPRSPLARSSSHHLLTKQTREDTKSMQQQGKRILYTNTSPHLQLLPPLHHPPLQRDLPQRLLPRHQREAIGQRDVADAETRAETGGYDLVSLGRCQ